MNWGHNVHAGTVKLPKLPFAAGPIGRIGCSLAPQRSGLIPLLLIKNLVSKTRLESTKQEADATGHKTQAGGAKVGRGRGWGSEGGADDHCMIALPGCSAASPRRYMARDAAFKFLSSRFV